MKNDLILAGIISEKGLANKLKTTIAKDFQEIEVLIFDNFKTMTKKSDFSEIDYLIIDMDKNHEDFKEIFKFLKQENPHIIRVLVVDTYDLNHVLVYHDFVHLIVEKKYLMDYLHDLFEKANRLRYLLQNQKLIKIINSFDLCPTIKGVYMEILHQVQKHDVSLKAIGELVEKDIVLSTKILQVSNMTAFSSVKRITHPKLAVVNLGVNILRALILSISFFNPDQDEFRSLRFVKQVEVHSMRVAKNAVLIAKELNVNTAISNDSFTAGLLHDLGRIVIMRRIPNWNEIQQVSDNLQMPLWKAEKDMIGASHTEIGAYFLSIWGFPPSIVDAVAFHHAPQDCKQHNSMILAILHVAEAITHRSQNVSMEILLEHLDLEYLDKMGIKENIIAFLKMFCGMPMEEGDETPDESIESRE